jgi:hypothetical protein
MNTMTNALRLGLLTCVVGVLSCGGEEAVAPATVTTGSLSVTIGGLPATVAPIVRVENGSFQRTMSASGTLTDLAPGTYTVTAIDVQEGVHRYGTGQGPRDFTVEAGTTPTTVTVSYGLATGQLAVTIGGLPGGTNADVTVTGPNFSQAVTASQTFNTIEPGSYTVEARGVVSAGSVYGPAQPNQAVQVDTSRTPTPVTVTYVNNGPAPLNLAIEDAYLVQATQRLGATTSDVPLVAGRDAVLRVFATASVSNTETPDVRVRLYQNGALVDTRTLPAQVASVPTSAGEAVLATSWNTTIAAALVQPGLSVLVDVDPANLIVEDDETDNSFPVGGTPQSVDVRVLGPVAVRLIPVHHDSTNRTGNVTSGNLSTYTTELVQLFPTVGVDADLGATYTTSAPPLQSNDGNGGWSTILSEIRTLRLSDGSSRYYYGVVSPDYSSGIAGLGYVPGSPASTSKASIGWDKTNSRAGVAVHEIGHNHGRRHSPGCGAGNPDTGYPYATGSIGAYGLDVPTMSLKSPSTHFDFMSYCSTTWVGDYVFDKLVEWREAEPLVLTSLQAAETTVMMIWGRMTARGMVLEPGFVMQARPAMPQQPGAYRVSALADDGSSVFSVSFDGDEVADLPGGPERHFAFAVPVDRLDGNRIRSLVLDGPGGRATRTASTARAATPDFDAGPRAGNVLRVEWDDRQYPMTMVRDRRTGRILALVRGGGAEVAAASPDVELLFSDGVRSAAPVRIP